MKTITIAIFLFLSLNIFGQDKYLIYFKDKNIKKGDILQKSSVEFEKAERLLSQRSIERRKKHMGADNYINYEDLPFNQDYIFRIKSKGIVIKKKLRWFNAVSAYLDNKQIKTIKDLPFVDRIEKVKILKYKHPNSQIPRKLNKLNFQPQGRYSLDYGPSFFQLNYSGVPTIHNLGITGSGVLIGILDSGFDFQHNSAFLNSNVIAEYDFVNNDPVTSNEDGDVPSQHNHGTNVLSSMAAYAPDTLIGVSFNAEYVLAKTENIPNETNIEEDNYAAALEWMDSIGVDITTSSVGYSEFDDGQVSYTYSDMDGNTTIVSRAENLSFQRGIVSLTSAGNEGNSSWFYITAPGDAYNILTIGATDSDSSLSSFSSRGPTYDGRMKPEVVNLGRSVYVARPSGGYGIQSGTSFSTPLTAGITGLLLSAHPHLKNTQVRQIILESGDRASEPNNEYGHGIISAPRAIGFPNISKNGELSTLHKIFTQKNGFDPSTVKIFYKINSGEFLSADMNFDGNIKFTFELGSLNENDTIRFYFTYNDTLGNSVLEPEENVFKLIYGSLNITLLTDIKENNILPSQFELEQNYPNPFNLNTTIEFTVPESGFAEVVVFNLLGQKIRTLYRGSVTPNDANSRLIWNGRDDRGKVLASGIYFYTLKMGDTFLSKKMVLLK